ncbi:MAG: rod shape-determining protein RodA [Alphaproteobacteria bacterium]|nr:rod shape-determining protein RodA [Alphaproteobacteria bacterium]MDX5368376.1 rod shape-determining protein RodA [Alphaproteobacteria bacterium]MDX5463171.1 rod shape-determining protein RodA [Alphaproteobacteria bacterium]
MALTRVQDDRTLGARLLEVNWGLLLLLCTAAAIGTAMLYSAADGSFSPWAGRHVLRFGVFACLAVAIAVIDIRFWMKLAYPAYFAALILLIGVEFAGVRGKGAERWIDLGVMQLQPSEIMKITLVMALARYYHGIPYDRAGRALTLVVPAVMVFAPVALVLRQPDLGTALLLVFEGAALVIAAGASIWLFVAAGTAAAGFAPIAWSYLKDYQKDRILTFLDPERDPMGAGYHIIQSKIAFGSGGVWGRGFMQGPQSQLDFLPEKQTDFVFTMIAEELGMIGGLCVLALYLLIVAYAIAVALQVRHVFGRLLAIGVSVVMFLYVAINTAMVMGLIPVVGVPLPLISYGGTSMLTVMTGFGLLMSAYVWRNMEIPRYHSHL